MIVPVEHWQNSSFDGSKNGTLKKNNYPRGAFGIVLLDLNRDRSEIQAPMWISNYTLNWAISGHEVTCLYFFVSVQGAKRWVLVYTRKHFTSLN